MHEEEEDFDLQDLEKLGLIFRVTFSILGLVVVGFIIWAGYKGWTWFVAIPLGSALFFGCRLLKTVFDKSIREAKQEARIKEGSEQKSEQKVSFDEFMDMSPQESDDEKITRFRHKQKKLKKAKPYETLLAASFIMLMVGVFWYGVGRIIALPFDT